MDKTELINAIKGRIKLIDLDYELIDRLVTSYIAYNKLDSKQSSHLRWELAALGGHYIEYVHDLERIIKTLNGETFA